MSWTEALTAVGSVGTPLAVAGFGVAVTRRESHNVELLKARIGYYRALAPDLNTLMCYMTFIGAWKEFSPVEIVALKRRLDSTLYCAVPLFSDPVRENYQRLEGLCFQTFGVWGRDAVIRSGAYRRRQAWTSETEWDPAWDAMFAKNDKTPIAASELAAVRQAYDALIAALVKDLNLNRARSQYTTDLVSLNAHAPEPRDVV